LAHPEKGFIEINENTVLNKEQNIYVPVEKRNIGYVFQEGRLFPHLTVEKNLLYGLKKNKESKITFDEVVELLNLSHILNSKPADISGGERQRTALGRSLLSSPDVLLLDEPFSAVDTKLRRLILPFLLRIHEKVRIPILVVSHDLPDLLKLTHTLCVMKDGKCLGHNDYYELLKNEEIRGILGTGTIVNSVEMKVSGASDKSGLTTLSKQNGDKIVNVKCEKSSGTYKAGQMLKLFIYADDIAISKNKLHDITIQNQLEGIVTDIIPQKTSLLCTVDVGFKLIVEFTLQSQKRMDIHLGSTVWCLFKSVAIDVAG
jgi:molybdate transport system ATP-binding protein